MRFAQLVFSGANQSAAYQQAGYNPPGGIKSAYEMASRLARNVKVANYLHHLAVISARTERSATLSRQRKRELLCDIAEDSAKPGDRLSAIVVDNRMTGDDAPIRIEGEITLAGILSDLGPSVGLPSADSPSLAALAQSPGSSDSDTVDVESSPTD